MVIYLQSAVFVLFICVNSFKELKNIFVINTDPWKLKVHWNKYIGG